MPGSSSLRLPRRVCPWLGLGLSVLILAGSEAPAIRSNEGGELTPGSPRELALAAGASTVLRVRPEAGRPYRLQVEQQGIDVRVEAAGEGVIGSGATDLVSDRWGLETLVLRCESPCEVRIEIRSVEPMALPGRVRASFEPLPEGTVAARRYLEAENRLAEAGASAARATKESYRAAGRQLSEVLGALRELAPVREAAMASYALGLLELWRFGDARAAVAPLIAAVDEFRRAGDLQRRAAAVNYVGLARSALGELDEARSRFEEALALEDAAGDAYEAASVRNNLCLLDHKRGRLAEARRCYEKVLEQYRAIGAIDGEATVETNLGGVDYLEAEPEPALAHFERALELRRKLRDASGEADTLNNLASLHSSLGELQSALEEYGRVLDIARREGDRTREARALNNLGYAYEELGELDRARAFFEEALPLRREVGDRRGQLATLNNLGDVERELGAPERAEGLHRQALALAREMANRPSEGAALSRLGKDRLRLGDPTAAVDLLSRAAEIAEAAKFRYGLTASLVELGRAQLAAGRAAAARETLTRCLRLTGETGNRLDEIEARTVLARVERFHGRLAEARRQLEEALDGIESLRGGVLVPGLKATFFATQRETFDLAIDTLMASAAASPGEGFARRALGVSERVRARSLLDLLHGPGGDLEVALPPAGRARRIALERRLSAKEKRRAALLNRGGSTGDVRAVEREISVLLAEFDKLDAETQRASPRYAAIAHPRPLDAAGIQALLDPETVLLEYALGEERSYLWAVTGGAVSGFTLPARSEIEARAREIHRRLAAGEAETGGCGARAELGRLLLGPAAELLRGKRLAVVADGALAYLPFAALELPAPGGGCAPLLVEHEVVELPSASALAAFRRLREGPRQAGHGIFVAADPVFDRADPRVRGTAGDGPSAALRTPTGPPLGRLRFSREEEAAILAAAPPGTVTAALDFTARRDAVLGSALERYRVLHFATHGVIDAAHPRLSSLVLSRVDERGRPIEGALRLDDIYALRLRAELVVLSGCQTALGREIRGEGLVGLASGFLYAGTPRVVASLWQVEDRATARLMGSFYRSMLADGRPPAAALRAAQLAVRRHKPWSTPYFWAPWVLVGDWK